MIAIKMLNTLQSDAANQNRLAFRKKTGSQNLTHFASGRGVVNRLVNLLLSIIPTDILTNVMNFNVTFLNATIYKK